MAGGMAMPGRISCSAGHIGGHGRAMSSRDGSRGSSPWHLPSPMSGLSTPSDRLTSQQSGSDSCGEHQQAHCNFEGCEFEDPSGQSDNQHWPRSTQLSDSDCATPRSNDASGQGGSQNPRDQALYEYIKSTADRNSGGRQGLIDRARDRKLLGRMLDVISSPGSTGALGNFREAVGMNETGPVVPNIHGATRREAISSMRTPSTSSQTGQNEQLQGQGSGSSAEKSGEVAAAPSTGGAQGSVAATTPPGYPVTPGAVTTQQTHVQLAAAGFGNFNPVPRAGTASEPGLAFSHGTHKSSAHKKRRP
eukprot:TRINITY_DN4889_c0_g1_i1.p1 TRINITY_DN4889_c0_g1~~TRINITY_DN4889_c0_g1_i1.p1  ORF type:complete len:319 (-),score=59.38 TRINITY_DN4889_c0_g1_i1:389-1303(-)